MANRTLSQFPSGSKDYRIVFDYLARPFVVVTLVNSADKSKNRVLRVGSDYRFINTTTIEILTSQAGFDIVQLHRYTQVDLVVDFRDGSVLTAKDLTNAELQAIHIAEEGRDQTVDLAKEYSDAAGSYAGNAKDSEDEARQIAASIKAAGLIGYITRRSFEKGFNVTTWNEVLLWEEDGAYYRWDGTLPKNVPAGSTPETSGGIGLGAWVSVGDSALRSQISNPAGASLYPSLQIARWRDEGDIRGWGAKCNGVADDTAAIQSAITEANGAMIKLKLPRESVVKIIGTILVPAGVCIDLNHSIIEGNGSQSVVGTNTIFESAYWDTGVLKSNWSIPAESVGLVGLVPDMRIYGGRVRFAETAVKMYQMIYGSSVEQLRITACRFPVIIKDSFYGTFDNIAAMTPPYSVSDSIGFQIESNIQAMGVRKCVASGFNKGWKITGSSATDCFDTCTAEHCVRGLDIYGGASGTVMNFELHNWYIEKNTIGVRVDGAAICQRLYLNNCYLHENVLHIDASTALSGGIDKSCVIIDSVKYPGGVNMQGRCGEKTFNIELDDSVASSHTSSTLPANYAVTGVEVKRVEALVNSSNKVIARNLRQTSVRAKTYTGSTLPVSLPVNVVPFSSVNTSNPSSATITTQVKSSPYNIVHVNLVVTENGTPKNAAGTIFGSIHVLQPASAKPFTISYDGSGNLIVTISGTNITNVNGIVQVV